MKKRPLVGSRAQIGAVTLLAIAALLVPVIETPASAASSASTSGNVTEFRVPLDRAVSVQDSFRVPVPADARLVGLQFGVLGVVGEHYLGADRGRDFAAQFMRDYGAQPAITGLIVSVPTNGSGEVAVDLPDTAAVPQSMRTPASPASLRGDMISQAQQSAMQAEENAARSTDAAAVTATPSSGLPACAARPDPPRRP